MWHLWHISFALHAGAGTCWRSGPFASRARRLDEFGTSRNCCQQSTEKVNPAKEALQLTTTVVGGCSKHVVPKYIY